MEGILKQTVWRKIVDKVPDLKMIFADEIYKITNGLRKPCYLERRCSEAYRVFFNALRIMVSQCTKKYVVNSVAYAKTSDELPMINDLRIQLII